VIGFGGGSQHQHFPSWTAPLTRYAYTGNTPEEIDPYGQGLMSDALMGNLQYPGSQAFGGLADQIPGAQQAGHQAQQLGAGATYQGYGNLMDYAQQAGGPVDQMMGLAGQVPGAYGQAQASYGNLPGAQANLWNQFAQGQQYGNTLGNSLERFGAGLPGQGAGAIGGQNVQNAMGAGQQVVNAALGAYHQMPADAYERVVQEGLPDVRASYSARGLGTSGEAARGEQDYIQRVRDELYQKDVANQIAALQTGASAASPAAAQAIGAQQAAIGRGQLGLGYGELGLNTLGQQSQTGLGYGQLGLQQMMGQGQLAGQGALLPGQMLGGLQDVAGAPLGSLQQAAALQGLPLGLVGQGLNLYNAGLNMPLQYQQALYNYTRQPQLDLLTQLTGTQQGQSRNWNVAIGGGGKGGGGGGGEGGN
jgi:hypothetical protein